MLAPYAFVFGFGVAVLLRDDGLLFGQFSLRDVSVAAGTSVEFRGVVEGTVVGLVAEEVGAFWVKKEVLIGDKERNAWWVL